jgi:TolA-binding protein
MVRWIVTLAAIALAASLGFLAGFARWGTQAHQIGPLEQRLEALNSEATTLRNQKLDLEQRLEQTSKEQERLARENDLLHQQRTTESLITGRGGELPAQPPK